MRLLRVVLVAALAVFAGLAGLLVAAAVGVATALLVFMRRLLRTPWNSRLSDRAQPRPAAGTGEVIDVTATEIPADPAPR